MSDSKQHLSRVYIRKTDSSYKFSFLTLVTEVGLGNYHLGFSRRNNNSYGRPFSLRLIRLGTLYS